MSISSYFGPELEVFEKAINWQRYLRANIATHLKGDVLEVGAGIGTMTKLYLSPESKVSVGSWLALEPDPNLRASIEALILDGTLPALCDTQGGTLQDIQQTVYFDSILYVDVLEHIKDDYGELALAIKHLNIGGRLIVMSPAHQGLFSALDHLAGHYRRYNYNSLVGLTPPGSRVIEVKYLDCIGMVASLGNRVFLHQGTPSENQVRLWDRAMVPLSRFFDPIFQYRVGKSILTVWEKTAFVKVYTGNRPGRGIQF
ncbi:MAG: hypothetical protein CBB68_14515 [Rhodospirillaceae bacterium TMED8]|nr:methyltransferase type 12 [Magnetovibrio sp.]OUT47939.1 MAG: hypothetical protein CBB68_14515 [Rhodospirillaceae bacterium TMED8]|tara:strand:- start:552 stop:1322 length:771 start_codon:yes stop_codon:yes gene_type:complete